eukprot:761566-Pelagomonas_calceolata.AAC.5
MCACRHSFYTEVHLCIVHARMTAVACRMNSVPPVPSVSSKRESFVPCIKQDKTECVFNYVQDVSPELGVEMLHQLYDSCSGAELCKQACSAGYKSQLLGCWPTLRTLRYMHGGADIEAMYAQARPRLFSVSDGMLSIVTVSIVGSHTLLVRKLSHVKQCMRHFIAMSNCR